MNHYVKNTELIVMQATTFCNINCKYCYLPDRNKYDLITDEILEETLKKLLSSNMLAEGVRFLWHCGEPLTAGISFYKKVMQLVVKYNINKINIQHGIQTNAMLINQEWCDFFKKHNFHIGVSLDGPEFLHNNSRITRTGKGTHASVMRGVQLLKSNGIPLSAISVVSNRTLSYPEEFFNFFIENDVSNLSLLIEEIIGENHSTDFQNIYTKSVSDDVKNKYRYFMQTLFELWARNKDKITIREFMEISINIYKIKNNIDFRPKSLETEPLKIITIQKNGDISTFCPELASGLKGNRKLFTIGNIQQINTLEDVIDNKNFKKISRSISMGISNCRKSCDYFKLCGGRSPGIKMYENNSFESTVTQHCMLQRQLLVDTVTNSLILACPNYI